MKLLGISGSLRKQSFNTSLVRTAAEKFAADEFTLADINMPLYNGDDEDASGLPPAAVLLADQIAAADAIVVATPEYNKGISGALKNALDWVSRAKSNPWAGKPVAILSTTAGRSGGERSQYNLRLALQPFNPRLLQGPEVLIAASYAAFENGVMVDEKGLEKVTELMGALHREVKRSEGA